MTAQEWIERLAAELDVVPPTPAEVEALLELAATAAHASERIAAPVSCWIAARAGRSPRAAAAAARRLAG